jgi:hypothetical protein
LSANPLVKTEAPAFALVTEPPSGIKHMPVRFTPTAVAA